MTRDEKLEWLDRWASGYQVFQAKVDNIEAVFGPLRECTFFDAIWNVFQAYTDAVSVIVGDEEGWLDWYACENDMGASGLKARIGPDTEPVIIDSTEKLLRVVMNGKANKTKILAIHSGGDWTDASADYLILPDGVDFCQQKEERDKWYREEYSRSMRRGERPKYISLVDWLKHLGACEPSEELLQIVWND